MDGHAATFSVVVPSDSSFSEDSNKEQEPWRGHSDFQSALIKDMHKRQPGELQIQMPDDVLIKKHSSTVTQVLPVSTTATADDDYYEDLLVRIDYTLQKPSIGAFFHEDSKDASKYMYTCSDDEQARCWFPCQDLVSTRHTFNLDFTMRQYQSNDVENMVLSSGDLMSQELVGKEYKTSYYEINTPVSPRSIILAAGPFHVQALTGFPSNNASGYAFCLPSQSTKELSHATECASKVQS